MRCLFISVLAPCKHNNVPRYKQLVECCSSHRVRLIFHFDCSRVAVRCNRTPEGWKEAGGSSFFLSPGPFEMHPDDFFPKTLVKSHKALTGLPHETREEPEVSVCQRRPRRQDTKQTRTLTQVRASDQEHLAATHLAINGVFFKDCVLILHMSASAETWSLLSLQSHIQIHDDWVQRFTRTVMEKVF